MFPCLANFCDVSTENSVQSTMHRIFLMVLNILGRYLNIIAMDGNMTISISLNTLYINCMKVVRILLIIVWSKDFVGEPKRIDKDFKVKPLLNRTRQIKSFSRLVNLSFRPLSFLQTPVVFFPL